LTQAPDSLEPGFAELGLSEDLQETVRRAGYTLPTPIQREAIPAMLAGRDVMGSAPTGSGKTAAFVLPILQLLGKHDESVGPRAVVIVPTRELCSQVTEAVSSLGRHLGFRALAVYGGAPISLQAKVLRRGVDVVVATPGRALDHIRRQTLDLTSVKVCVLDEADEMLDMGFEEDLNGILELVPENRQMALFSATFPPHIQRIADSHLRDPVRLKVARDVPAEGAAPLIRSVGYIVARHAKAEALLRVLDLEAPKAALVFCRTRADVEALAEELVGRGRRAEALHGGLSQAQRERVLQRLRSEASDLIVATDVAARGIDIGHLTHVVHFDVPQTAETWVHRTGRVGRAGRTGVSLTLAEPRDRAKMRQIERVSGHRIEIGVVPSLADLRDRRLDVLRERIAETMAEEGLAPYRALAEKLSEGGDALDVAAAALRALVRSTGGEIEVPPEEENRRAAAPRPPAPVREAAPAREAAPVREAAPAREAAPVREAAPAGETAAPAAAPDEQAPRAADRDARASERPVEPRRPDAYPGGLVVTERRMVARKGDAPVDAIEGTRANRALRREAARGPVERGPSEPERPAESSHDGPRKRVDRAGRHEAVDPGSFVRLRVGLSAANRVRPGELFGVLVSDAGIRRDAVGTIRIGEHFSTLDVAPDVVDKVAEALIGGALRGRSLRVERMRR
jgi:ATP-dependent RNA helicase DeaD